MFEVGLDWHKVLDTMLSPVRTPTTLLTDRLKRLESLPARITIISFTGAGDRYDSTVQEIDAFRDQRRASGCQLGGGFFLTNEKTGRGGKAELISRLRIRAFMDDRPDICAEIRRTGCFAMGFDAHDYPQETSGAIQVLTDYIWSRLEHWDAHYPLQAFVLQPLARVGEAEAAADADRAFMPECLTKDDSALRGDQRFPRTDREIATKMLKVCKSGRFGIIFQRMVEESRLSGIGMPCGRVMLATIFRHFQLEKDRIGTLGERNLLTLRLKGHKTEDLITFQEKYRYILAAIPSEDLPRETTLFNHLLDELEQFTPLAAKIAKSRESPLGSHRRSTKWLWEKVDLHIELERIKANRQVFDKKLRDSHTADLATTYNPKAIPANPAKTDKPKKEKSKEDKKKEKKEKKDKAKKEKQRQPLQQPVDVHAAPGPKSKAPKGPPKTKPRGNTPTPPTTPRSQQVKRAADMTAQEKARTPCAFYAYNSCRAKQCAFLHDSQTKYKGPPPKALRFPKQKAKATAAVAQVHALPAFSNGKISWLWDTAAGRHLFGKQALTPSMRQHAAPSQNPVNFTTAQQSVKSLAFKGSPILEGEEVYILNECPPAQSIGKTV